MKKAILDTNFLMMPYAEKIDVFAEIDRLVRDPHGLATPSGVVKELRRITEDKSNKGRDKTAAKIALQLLEKKDVEVLEGEGSVDEEIAAYAEKNPGETVVCTNDKELRRRVRKTGAQLIGMRSRKHLDYV